MPGRPKRGSKALEKAQKREASLRGIDTALDLGNGHTLENYGAQIQDLQSLITQYHTLLAQLDGLSKKITAKEKEVNEWSENMLMGVRMVYGKDSEQYKTAGGTPTSEQKRNNNNNRPPNTPPDSPSDGGNIDPPNDPTV